MKMAKATEADLDAALKITQIITDLEKRYMPASDNGEFAGHFDRSDPEQCLTALNAILDAAYKGNLFRVTFGMVVVIDPRNELVDPEADTLEVHPKVKAALEAGEWRPIDTAPKDGTEFQAWVEQWEPRCRINPDSEALEIWGRIDYDMDGWGVYGHLTATHWMPLPPAPEKDNG